MVAAAGAAVSVGSASPTTAAETAAQTFHLRIRATDMGGPFRGRHAGERRPPGSGGGGALRVLTACHPGESHGGGGCRVTDKEPFGDVLAYWTIL
ncbi:hypothetical protein GCM10017562_08390 [Streptomyces roseofulvus]